MTTSATTPEIVLDPLKRLRKDLSVAAKTLSDREARYLVDLYYQVQGLRITGANQIRGQQAAEEPHAVLQWFFNNAEMLENSIKRALDIYSDQNRVGRWSKSIVGIGPVIASGLLAHLYPLMTPTAEYPNSFNTAGKILRFAGLDPTSKWMSREDAKKLVKKYMNFDDDGGAQERSASEVVEEIAGYLGRNPIVLRKWALQGATKNEVLAKMTESSLSAAIARRPWNAQLKVLCWKLGESFIKVSNHEQDFYGKLYKKKKGEYTAKNEAFEYRDQAVQTLREKNIGKTTEAYGHYSKGLLPPGRIHARARRYAVKIFLSHFHEVAFWVVRGELAPAPYVMVHKGHTDYIEVPHLVEELPDLFEAKHRSKATPHKS